MKNVTPFVSLINFEDISEKSIQFSNVWGFFFEFGEENEFPKR